MTDSARYNTYVPFFKWCMKLVQIILISRWIWQKKKNIFFLHTLLLLTTKTCLPSVSCFRIRFRKKIFAHVSSDGRDSKENPKRSCNIYHSSEIICLMKLSSEMEQNFPYFWNKKTQIVFIVFHFKQLWICYSGCLGLYWH